MERRLPLLLFLGGLACLIAGIATGEGRAGIFIIFPFIYGSSWLMLLGIGLIFVSIIGYMFSMSSGDPGQRPSGQRNEWQIEKKAGGLILIGPIPIVIFNDKILAIVLLVVGIATAIILWLVSPSFL
jgi:uncharacterized protein (TIGR00304 family)